MFDTNVTIDHIVFNKEIGQRNVTVLRKILLLLTPYFSRLSSISASGRLRAAIGKTNLLTTKKFKQFRGLCDEHVSMSVWTLDPCMSEYVLVVTIFDRRKEHICHPLFSFVN